MSTTEERILSALSLFLVAVQAYLVYRVDKARLKIEKYVGIGEKSELEVKPYIQNEMNEVIMVTNKGLIPIEEVRANIDITVERRNEANLSLRLKWARKTLLSSKEAATIPLHEKISDFLRQNKLVRLRKLATIPIEDPETGNEVEDTLYVASLIKQFSMMLDIEIESKTQGQTNTVRKKYRLTYGWRFPPFSEYEDDYTILINEHMGEWVS